MKKDSDRWQYFDIFEDSKNHFVKFQDFDKFQRWEKTDYFIKKKYHRCQHLDIFGVSVKLSI